MKIKISKDLCEDLIWDLRYNHFDDKGLSSSARWKMEQQRKDLIKRLKKAMKRSNK